MPPRIPGYDILALLASGGMGLVYKARHQRLEREVAIKVIRPEQLAHDSSVIRFQREARAAARLSHPNIVSIFDADQVDGTHYLVMEYVNGVNLAKLVAHWGPLPILTACDFIRQVALGLQHAHDKGLVHRDIKPNNLIVTPTPLGPEAGGLQSPPPGGFLVKILDMGLARLGAPTDTDASTSSVTQSGHVLGTPDYIAPEQVEDAHQADIRSDLYGLGCTFYYLLTGRVPFPGMSIIQKLDGHRWKAPVPVNQHRPEVLPEVAAIVHKLMAKRPADRCALPAELVADLERFLRVDRAASGTEHSAMQTDIPPRFETATTLPKVSPPAASVERARDHCLRLPGHRDWVTSVAFSPDGRSIISGSRDGGVSLWDAEAGHELRRFDDHGDWVLCVAWTPDGRHIFSGSRDQTIRLWDVASGDERRRFAGHTASVYGLAVTPDGRFLLSGSEDQTVRLWNLATGREARHIGGKVIERHWDEVLSVAVASDGRVGLSGSRDRSLRLWDLHTGREMRSLRGHRSGVASVALSPDGRHALSAGGNRLWLWDIGTGEVVGRLEGHTKPVLSVAFSLDGQLAVSGGEDRTVRLWDVARRQQLHCFDGHVSWVLGVTFAPDGRRVASGGSDRAVCIWQVPAEIA